MKPLIAILVVLAVSLVFVIDWEADVSKCSSALQKADPAWSAQLRHDLCVAIGMRRFTQEMVEQHSDWPWRAIVDRRTEVGMSSEMVRVSRGRPIGIRKAMT